MSWVALGSHRWYDAPLSTRLPSCYSFCSLANTLPLPLCEPETNSVFTTGWILMSSLPALSSVISGEESSSGAVCS